jgi:hypothetical protein
VRTTVSTVEVLQVAVAVECGLTRAPVVEVLQAASAAVEVLKLEESWEFVQPRPKPSTNKVFRAGRWQARPRAGLAYYTKQGLLHQVRKTPSWPRN